MKFFKPNRFFKRITSIDIEKDIIEQGISFLLLDIDNTVLTRDTHEIPSDVENWLKDARLRGLQICFVSNNWHQSVKEVGKKLGIPVVTKAVKPLPHAFFKARRMLGASRKETLVIGDQFMTDILGAHNAGLKAYLLLPLVDADLTHTLLLRHVEKIFLRNIRPEK